MSDHEEVMAGIQKSAEVSYSALTPNLKGFEKAVRNFAPCMLQVILLAVALSSSTLLQINVKALA